MNLINTIATALRFLRWELPTMWFVGMNGEHIGPCWELPTVTKSEVGPSQERCHE